jgi:hypothetical protein
VAAGFDRAISYLPSGMCCVLNWRSFPPLRLPYFPGRLLCLSEPRTEFVQFGYLNKEIGGVAGENCNLLLKRAHFIHSLTDVDSPLAGHMSPGTGHREHLNVHILPLEIQQKYWRSFHGTP